MAFHSDFSFVVDGQAIAYTKEHPRLSSPSVKAPQGIIMTFPALEGKIIIKAAALDAREPVSGGLVGPRLPWDRKPASTGVGGIVTKFNYVKAVLELIPPGRNIPVQSWPITAGSSTKWELDFEHIVAHPAPPGEWKVRLTNKDTRLAGLSLLVTSVIDREVLRRTSLYHRLLDHAYLVLLEALQPSASISGNTLTISFSKELRDFFGGGAGGPLGTKQINLPFQGSVVGEAHLASFEVFAESGQPMLEKIEEEASSLGPFNRPSFLAKWRSRMRPEYPVVHVSASFTDVHIVSSRDVLAQIPHVGPILDPFNPFETEFEGVLRNIMVNLYIAFDDSLEHCYVLPIVRSEFEPTDIETKLVDALGLFPDLNGLIRDELPGPIEQAGRQIGRFLGEALTRLAGGESVFHRLTANDTSWQVRHTPIPRAPIPTTGGTPLPGGTPDVPHHPGTTAGGVDNVGGVDGDVLQPPTGDPATDPTLGLLPPPDEFVVVKPETLARLDQIKTLVFVMMENRSFDHMLGYLRNRRGPQYDGVTGSECNETEIHPQPVCMTPARDIGLSNVTKIPFSPNHEFDPVAEQIADGAMSGFAQDFEDEHPGSARMVMSYYDQDHLPVYDNLAGNYNVCNRWYCSHPGPTFPNRFVTLTGLTPELDNYAVDDPILGFLQQRTIFDVLNDCGITWAVFESDLSIIRMFDRFRLNASQVRPYRDRADRNRDFEDRKSFVDVARQGKLPQVVFVEPNFADIPPISTANDDHPPADLRQGQNFIAEVVKALTFDPDTWRQTMLVITYDEHGGFYDHKAPPGSALGRPELIGKIPRVHPNGQDFMGPRVPAFVMSSFVSAGSVCNEMLDHTSIIKTILLRHRAMIPTRVFTQFGPRVNMIAHLGVALDLDQARAEPPPLPQRMKIPLKPSASAGAAPLLAPAKPDDFHESLRRAPLPKRR